MARSLLARDEWTDALFRTTPWAFARAPGLRRVLAYALFANYVGSYVLWLLLLPALLLVVRLEEAELRERFGAEWDAYARRVPRFLPRRVRAVRIIDGTPAG